MVTQVSIKKLLSVCGSPFDIPLWRGLRDPLELHEVREAVEAGQLNSPGNMGESSSEHHSRAWHIQRVAWFVVHGWDEPIVIDPEGLWPVIDGNHRLSAAIARGDTDICVELLQVPVASE